MKWKKIAVPTISSTLASIRLFFKLNKVFPVDGVHFFVDSIIKPFIPTCKCLGNQNHFPQPYFVDKGKSEVFKCHYKEAKCGFDTAVRESR